MKMTTPTTVIIKTRTKAKAIRATGMISLKREINIKGHPFNNRWPFIIRHKPGFKG